MALVGKNRDPVGKKIRRICKFQLVKYNISFQSPTLCDVPECVNMFFIGATAVFYLDNFDTTGADAGFSLGGGLAQLNVKNVFAKREQFRYFGEESPNAATGW